MYLTAPPLICHQYATLTLTLPLMRKHGSIKSKVPPRCTQLHFLDDSQDQRLIADTADHRISSRYRARALCASRIYPGRGYRNRRGYPVPEQCFEPRILARTERPKVENRSLQLPSALTDEQVFWLRYWRYLACCSGEATSTFVLTRCH